MHLYVSNLSFAVEDQNLRSFVAPFGEVIYVKTISGKLTGKSRGFAFVEMSGDTAHKKAIAELNNDAVAGSNLKVMEVKLKENSLDQLNNSFLNNSGDSFKKSTSS